MIYSCLRIHWLLPSPLSSVSPIELTDGRGGRGGVGAKSYDGKKAWSSINHSKLPVFDRSWLAWNMTLLQKKYSTVIYPTVIILLWWNYRNGHNKNLQVEKQWIVSLMNEARVGAWPTPGLHGEYSRGTGTQVQPFLSIHHVGGAIKIYFSLENIVQKFRILNISWGLQRSETRVFVRRG